MPIPNIVQPEILPVEETLRLRKFDDHFDFAFLWYQDPELVWLVDGVKEPYTEEKLGRMYHYLDKHGERYFIEAMENGIWKPVGDVCLCEEDLPIVIGDPNYRGKGVGAKVIAALIARGRTLGWRQMYVEEIYSYNLASQKCFEKSGFRVHTLRDSGNRYVIDL